MKTGYDILKSVQKVVDKSRYVNINYNAIYESIFLFEKPKSSNSIISEYLDIKNLNKEQLTRFFLILESIDFCFWGNPKWKIEYKGKEFDGYYGITIALIRALEEGYNFLDFEYLKNISEKDFKNILRGSILIPMFEERLEIVRNIAKISLDVFNGEVYNCFANLKSDDELVKTITENFNDFYDVSLYENDKVYFLKRATLLANDLFCYVPEIRDKIKNTNNLLAGADYKLPQVLRELNILKYDIELENMIDNNIIIEHDSQMEIEIRANTIYAIDLIKKELQKLNNEMSSFEVGTAIWLLSKNEKYKNKPHHLCNSIFY